MNRGTFLAGCASSATEGVFRSASSPHDNLLALFYTSNFEAKGLIRVLDLQAFSVRDVPLAAGGLARFRPPETVGHLLYAPAVGAQDERGGRVVVFDGRTSRIRFLESDALPVDVAVMDDVLAIAHNHANTSLVVVINRISGARMASQVFDGVPQKITRLGRRLLLFADHPAGRGQTIYILDSGLRLLKQIENQRTAFCTDTRFHQGRLFVANVSAADFNSPSRELTLLDLQSETLSFVPLGQPSPYRLLASGSKLLVTHFVPTANVGSAVTVLSGKTDQTLFNLKNNLYRSVLIGSVLYSVEATPAAATTTLFSYSVTDFRLRGTRQIERPPDMFLANLTTLMT